MASLRTNHGSHLVLRSRTYHFRLRIPADLSSKIPANEFLKYLNTKVS